MPVNIFEQQFEIDQIQRCNSKCNCKTMILIKKLWYELKLIRLKKTNLKWLELNVNENEKTRK